MAKYNRIIIFFDKHLSMYRNRRYLWQGHVFSSLTICFGKVSRSYVVLADAAPTTQAEPFETITEEKICNIGSRFEATLARFFLQL